MQLIQLALDIINLDKAFEIAGQVIDYVDYIEAGTPLIKNNGKDAIKRLKEAFPNKIIIADMKTIDSGASDCQIAFEAGADGIIVQAVAPYETILKVAEVTRLKNKILMLDSLGLKDIDSLDKLVSDIRPNYTIIHIGIDEQPTHDLSILFDMAKNANKYSNLSRLSLAGGIGSELLGSIDTIPENVKVIVVGAAITMSPCPLNEAAAIKNEIVRLNYSRK